MITFDENPEPWVALITELDDAREHLQSLIDQMVLAKSIDQEDFQVQMAHVFAHLNRSWHIRDGAAIANEEDWAKASAYPSDLSPIA